MKVKDRIKQTRMLAGLSRKDMEDKYDIPSNTLQCWESGRVKLTEKGANRLISAFEDSGIKCTKEWLFKGQAPKSPLSLLKQPVELNLLRESSKETCFFDRISFSYFGSAYVGWDEHDRKEKLSLEKPYIIESSSERYIITPIKYTDKNKIIAKLEKGDIEHINLENVDYIGEILWVVFK